jgi:uncharacterized protein
LEAVLAASASEAAAAVARTPSQLAVLRRAGVVDAGGRGLELLLRGALAYERGEAAGAVEVHEIDLPALDGLEEDGYGYETVFVVTAGEGSPLDLAALRSELDRLGESVLVAGSERAAKIHVHNERPDQVIALGLRFGSLSRITVENLDRQAQDVRRTASPIEPAAQALPAIEAPAIQQHARGPVVVAVAPGSGLAGVFSAAGAATVVAGGQSANPSAGELATAIRSTGREEVIVLANNANARLAAEQAARLCPDVEVAVVPTRNPAEGVAAMLSLDPAASMAANVKRMVIAVRALQTLQVTVAIRDARIGRRKVHKDDYIVLGPDDKLLAAGSDCRRAVLDAIGRLKPGFELLTLYRGEGVDEQAGAALSRAIADSLDGVDVEVVDGGQPHYRYLISAE